MQRIGFIRIATLAAATTLVGGTAFAQCSSMSGMSGSSMASAADKKFVAKALQGGMAEVELGKLATEKASSQDVKDFGQKMVADHTRLGDQMKPIASQIGVNPPSGLSAKDQALMSKLQGLNGSAFDKAYMNAMVADHKEDVKEFKMEETSGKDGQVKQAAAQGESVISGHLQMAESIQKKMM
jgi:putative membrane protein